MTTKLQHGATILFIGDSITDCGRRTSSAPLGDGYVRWFSTLQLLREPEKKITVINKGISGDRTTGLCNRWSDDVIRHAPDWLSIKIGINDLHSFLRDPTNPDAVPLERFANCYDEVLRRTRAELPQTRILLIDPFYISVEHKADTWRRKVLDLLPGYIDVVAAMAAKYETLHLTTHQLFMRLLKHYDADTFCPEPVHPNPVGHLAIAEAVYRVLQA